MPLLLITFLNIVGDSQQINMFKYCRCFTTNEINELSQLLMNDLQIVDNALYQNYTINETCAGLNNTMCWKDDSYNLSGKTIKYNMAFI